MPAGVVHMPDMIKKVAQGLEYEDQKVVLHKPNVAHFAAAKECTPN
jgi:hypothetical protein